jgi:hypothetical protein
MAYISVFKVNSDASALTVIANAPSGNLIQTVKLWTQDTFKDYSQALDFTSKLEQISNTESFTITASEIGVTTLDGIYFIELVDDSEPGECLGCDQAVMGVATDFARFQFCLSEFLCKLQYGCVGCDAELHKALTMNMYIDGLRNMLQLGNWTTAISFWKNLNRACSSTCVECCNLSAIQKKGLGFQTLGNNLILY